MEIKETPLFTRRVSDLLDDDEYALLQAALVVNPRVGVTIPRTGGIRKMRWAGSGRGKRGGARIIYFAALEHETILMLYIYPRTSRTILARHRRRRCATSFGRSSDELPAETL